jgi:hypothetical protein
MRMKKKRSYAPCSCTSISNRNLNADEEEGEDSLRMHDGFSKAMDVEKSVGQGVWAGFQTHLAVVFEKSFHTTWLHACGCSTPLAASHPASNAERHRSESHASNALLRADSPLNRRDTCECRQTSDVRHVRWW